MKYGKAVRILTEAYINNKCKNHVVIEFQSYKGVSITFRVYEWTNNTITKGYSSIFYSNDPFFEEKVNEILAILRGEKEPELEDYS